MPTLGTAGSGQTTASTTLTVTGITNSGSNTALFAGVGTSAPAAHNTTSVTYAGTTLVESWDDLPTVDFHNSGHYMVAPAASGSLVLTIGGADDEVTLFGVPLSDVDQNAPVGTPPATASGTGTTATVNIPSGLGQLVIGMLYAFWNGSNGAPGLAKLAQQIVGAGTVGAVFAQIGAPNVPMVANRAAGTSTTWTFNGLSFRSATFNPMHRENLGARAVKRSLRKRKIA
jgi:hypothetical protein